MRWPSNPFSRSRGRAPEDPEDPETAAVPRQVTQEGLNSSSRFQTPTEKFSAHQIFYVFVLDGVGALVLSGGINFAIAYAMYTTQNLETRPIRLFQLPNTLAGDAAVTIIVQCIITWLVELALVNYDLRRGNVHPIGFVPEPSSRLVRWFMFLDDQEREQEDEGSAIITTTTATATTTTTATAKQPAGRLASGLLFLFSQVLRAFAVAVLSFCLLWGPSIGVLTTVGTKVGGDWYFEQKWAPQIFKLVLGGVLGLLVTPPFAMFWLVRCGWALQRQVGSSREGSIR